MLDANTNMKGSLEFFKSNSDKFETAEYAYYSRKNPEAMLAEKQDTIKRKNQEIDRMKRVIQTRDLEIQNLELSKQFEINKLKQKFINLIEQNVQQNDQSVT